MRTAHTGLARVLVAVVCAAVFAFAAALPASGAQQNDRGGHSLVKKLPKKWLKAHKLTGTAATPLADPDRDGACNWVEFRQRTNPRKPNQVTTTPPAAAVPASRIILLEGTVIEATPTAFTLQLDGNLIVDVAITPTAPVVDGDGLTTALAVGQNVHAFVSQTSDRKLSSVLVLVDDRAAEVAVENPGDAMDDGDDCPEDENHKGDRNQEQ